MAAPNSFPVPFRRLTYNPNQDHTYPRFPSLFKQRQPRPSYINVSQIVESQHDSSAAVVPRSRPGRERRPKRKLAGQRDDALRFLRSIISTPSNTPKQEGAYPDAQRRRASKQKERGEAGHMPGTDFLRGGALNAHLRRPSLHPAGSDVILNPPRKGSKADTSQRIPEVRPIAAGHGVAISVNLAEPVLFLQGFDRADSNTRSTAMLRGSLHLKVAKSAKIKAVSLKFRGQATTKWPEGIPPKKMDFEETDTLMNHTWPFFNAQFPTAEGGTGADVVQLAQSGEKHGSPYLSASPINSNVNLTTRETKRLSLAVSQSRSFEKAEGNNNKHGPTVAQKGYRMFHPGDYIYNFELPLDSRLPESIDVDLGSVKYELEATVERAGAFRANLLGTKDVVLIRAPSEGSLEQVEPIAISRNWEDQLHYDIVISGKSFPLGSKVPIAFKLTPLAKVQCHRVKVYVTENTEYFCSGKRVHRMEPTRKILLFEKRADGPSVSKYPGSNMRVTAGGGIPYDQRSAAAQGQEIMPQDTSNLLGALDGDSNIGPTEMEFNVQLPGCQHAIDKERPNSLQFDTTYTNIQVHHWIKILMRLSKADETDPSKRRHFEISIDSPFNILSCRASQANTALPAYTSPESMDPTSTSLADCGCPGAPRRQVNQNHVPTLNALNEGRRASLDREGATAAGAAESQQPPLTRPQPAHVHTNTPAIQRPMHMLRAPSFNPPAFEDEPPPPPLVTPPPQYNDIASPTSGLADYFGRLEVAHPAVGPGGAVGTAATAAHVDEALQRERSMEGATAVEAGVDEVDSDPDAPSAAESRGSVRGRVNVPLTPGSPMSRSMEIRREQWSAGIGMAR